MENLSLKIFENYNYQLLSIAVKLLGLKKMSQMIMFFFDATTKLAFHNPVD